LVRRADALSDAVVGLSANVSELVHQSIHANTTVRLSRDGTRDLTLSTELRLAPHLPRMCSLTPPSNVSHFGYVEANATLDIGPDGSPSWLIFGAESGSVVGLFKPPNVDELYVSGSLLATVPASASATSWSHIDCNMPPPSPPPPPPPSPLPVSPPPPSPPPPPPPHHHHPHTPHSHSPHSHSPHGHSPHGHSPHGHSPHGHSPHSHSPHGHAPHSHNPCNPPHSQSDGAGGCTPSCGALGGTHCGVCVVAARSCTNLGSSYDCAPCCRC